MNGDFTTRDEVAAVYRRRAARYDLTARLYYIIGFREWAYRRMAVDRLKLPAGGTVVEIGCGTGLNFALLQEKVGPLGRIIGVDLSPEMLTQAQKRVERNGWTNVELVRKAAADYVFPQDLDGILSTFALTLEPEFDSVISRGARALGRARRLVVMDLRLPAGRLRYLAPLLIWLVKPFAVSMELTKRHPWESVVRHLRDTTYEERYFGVVYIVSGSA